MNDFYVSLCNNFTYKIDHCQPDITNFVNISIKKLY